MPDEPAVGHAVLAAVESALGVHFGRAPARAAVSFLGVETMQVLRFEPVPGELVYVSLGMARRPMTDAGDVVPAPDGPRAELLMHVRDPHGDFGDAWRRLALLAAAPAVEGVVYRARMTVDLGEPLAARSRCTGGVVAEGPIAPIPAGEAVVHLLEVLPATGHELAWARARGTDALQAVWAAQGVDLRDLARQEADLPAGAP